ncbi:MAG TPA: DUF1800 domain-containing protein [Candidatus Baltobacteraceae bacterium]|jgi:uncharacterized protein (DUF1800 family)
MANVDVAGIHRPAGTLDAAGALRPYGGPWNERLAAHLMRRAGFGGSPDEIRAMAAMSPAEAVGSLIHFPSTANMPQPADVFDPVAYLRGQFGNQRPADMTEDQKRERNKGLRMQERQSVLALQAWWLDRMLNSPAPLQEKMALYFHGHFTSAAIQKGVTPPMVLAQNQLFRSNALGNLRELTRGVSKDPAMLIYLDNALNVATHPNENYARELMELFTLGVDHYTENDVRESARAWSGWTVFRRTGEAGFVGTRHDDGTKTFLGKTGNFNGDDIVDIIFEQPQAATFFAGSLLNYFVYNDPEPALVDAVAALIRKHDFELAPVMSTLLRSDVFFSERAYRALVKSPAEFVVGAHKALGLTTLDPTAQRGMNQMGQILFYPPNVAGWPGGQNWVTSQMVIARQNYVAGLVNSQVMAQSSWLPSVPMTAGPAAAALIASILQGDASPLATAQLASYLNGASESALGMLSGENRDERVRGAAYLTMAMPAFQLA